MRPKLALLCCLAAALLAGPVRALTVEQEAAGLRVRTAGYSVLVDPANGARITSLVVDGAEMTRLCPDGHGGLFEESHSADFAFDVLRQDADGQRFTLALAARAGTLRIIKEFAFSDAAPAFTVRLTFENAAPYALSGADAPALRHLVLPAGGLATGRELYCTARSRGAEVLSADFLLARAYSAAAPAAALRWMAVSEPAGRRTLGFALTDGASRALPPLRAQGGGLLTGWSVPAVPAGSALTVGVLVVPLRGFTALAELNSHFAADAVPGAADAVPEAGARGRIHLSLMPLESMPDLSIITRTYDAGGRETEPCDPAAARSAGALQGPPGGRGLSGRRASAPHGSCTRSTAAAGSSAPSPSPSASPQGLALSLPRVCRPPQPPPCPASAAPAPTYR